MLRSGIAALALEAAAAAAAAAPFTPACRLVQQLSSAKCTANDFGCNNNNTMWVSGGCRGVFQCNNVDRVKCDPCDPSTPSCNGKGRHVCECKMMAPPPPAPKYMLLDDRNVVSSTAQFVFGKVEKHPAGAMIHDGDPARPYEVRIVRVWHQISSHPNDLLSVDALRQYATKRVV